MKMIKTGLCVGAVMAAMLVRGTSGTSEVNPSDITFETLITQQYVQHAFTEEVEINGEIQTERRIEHLTPSIRRQLYPDGRIDVIDMSKEDLQQMTLHPDKKVAEMRITKGFGIRRDPYCLELLNQPLNHPQREELGQKTENGRTVVGFRSQSSANSLEFWVDKVTGLPVKMVIHHLNSAPRRRIIWTDFSFEPQLDPDQFKIVPPDGYKVKSIIDGADTRPRTIKHDLSMVAVLLEEGIYTEETVGDLDRAIGIYQQIIDDDQANRKYVSEALFRKGRCHVTVGQVSEALEDLKKLTRQFPDQKKLVKKANELIAELSPKPLFPELEGCRLKYAVPLSLDKRSKLAGRRIDSFYQTDMIEALIRVDPALENNLDRFEFAQVRIDETGAETKFPVQHYPGSIRYVPSDVLDAMTPGDYRGLLTGYHGSNVLAQFECWFEIKPAMRSQIGVDEIQPDGDIHFISVQQSPNDWGELKSTSFINSDFVHIEEMFDGDGNNVGFTEKHEGSLYRYKTTLNKPVLKGETLFLGSRGWKEDLVSKVAGSDNEYRYRMNHTPGGNVPVRRVEIYRLPQGAELLSTTPADLPHRIREDGRVEILVDTVIPTGGSLLTEFRYRLDRGRRDPILLEDAALRLLAANPTGAASRQIAYMLVEHYQKLGSLSKIKDLKPYLDNLVRTNDAEIVQYDAELYFMQAVTDLVLRDFESAESGFKYVMDEFPDSRQEGNSQYWYAMSKLFQQKYEEACSEFENYIKRFNDGDYVDESYYQCGVCLFGMEQYTNAIERFTYVIENYPESPVFPEACSMRGDLYGARGGDWIDKALQDYERAIAAATKAQQATYATFQAAALYEALAEEEGTQQDIIDLVQSYLDKWGAKGGDIAKAMFWIGKTKLQLGEIDQAVSSYVDAIVKYGDKISQDGLDMMINEMVCISVTHLDAGQQDKLREDLEGALADADEATLKRTLRSLIVKIAKGEIEPDKQKGDELPNLDNVSPFDRDVINDPSSDIKNHYNIRVKLQHRLADHRDQILLEDAALRLLAAIRDKDDAVLRELSADHIEGWRDALPEFAFEARERFRQLVGSQFEMRVEESFIMDDFAAVKCVGPEALNGIYLALLFEKTESGWKNVGLENSPPSKTLESHLFDNLYLFRADEDTGDSTFSALKLDRYVTQVSGLKQAVDSIEQRKALDRIEGITAKATFHQGALVELAKLVVKAPHNHQRIVKAAELASQFGYHTGALVKVAEIAAKADRECEELDEILELVVLKLGGTPNVIQLARDAVSADTDDELADIRSGITELQESADYMTLEEALEGQKTLLDSAGSFKPLDLQPAPWTNGEVLRYRVLSKTGMEMGQQIWAVNNTVQESRDCWNIEQRLVIPSVGTLVATQVIAEKESFVPLSGRNKHPLGTVSAQYLPGKVVFRHGDAAASREIDVPGQIFDNEQVIYLMRRLPLERGYKATFPIMSIPSGTPSLECRIRVMGREETKVEPGSFDCWKVRIQVYAGGMKAVEQTAWFTVEGHLPIKFVTDQADLELAEQTDMSAMQIPMVLKEQGVSVRLPEDWFGYELPSAGKDSEILRLLPPEMKLEGLLCKTVRQPAVISIQEIAVRDIEVLKGYFKNYTVREDSVVEKKVNGIPAYIYAADYEDQGEAKVEYRAYYVADSCVFWFVFRISADQFNEEKDELDVLIEGLKVQE